MSPWILLGCRPAWSLQQHKTSEIPRGEFKFHFLPPHNYVLEVPSAISVKFWMYIFLTPINAQTDLPVALWACQIASVFPSQTMAVTGLKLCWKHTGHFPAARVGSGVYLLRESPIEAVQSSVGYRALPAWFVVVLVQWVTCVDRN